jgi:hypothetical protein
MFKLPEKKDVKNLGEFIVKEKTNLNFSNSVFKVDDLENPRKWLEFVDNTATGHYINIFIPDKNHPYILTGPSSKGLNRWTYAFRLETGIKHFESSSLATREEAFDFGLNKFFASFCDSREYIYQFEKAVNEGDTGLLKRIVEANSNYRNRGFV